MFRHTPTCVFILFGVYMMDSDRENEALQYQHYNRQYNQHYNRHFNRHFKHDVKPAFSISFLLGFRPFEHVQSIH